MFNLKKIIMEKNSQLQNFEWPKFNSDKERIKFNTKKYKNYSITEAFEIEYGLKKINIPNANIIPENYKLGDIIDVNIKDITKECTYLDIQNSKKLIVSKNNLWKYNIFRNYVPPFSVPAKIISISKDRIIVDIIMAMLEKFIEDRIKNPNIQKNIYHPDTIVVKNLKLTKGGFIGKVIIPPISEFIGENYEVDAFIPGSQIVLNITDDFEKFNGTNVEAFVVNCIKNNTDNKISLICSPKEYIKYLGELNMIDMFNNWCEENEKWSEVKNNEWNGKVTGIINSSKKCGVFIEIPELFITGIVNVKSNELVNYKPHQNIKVKIIGFEEETFYNQITQQTQHIEPYIIKNNILEKCNIKPILQFV